MKSAGVNDDPVKRAFLPGANRDSAGASGGVWHQGRGISVVPPALQARAEVVQHLFALPPTGVHHRQHTLHEPAPLHAVRTPTRLAQQHAVPFRTLALVVRRFHPSTSTNVHSHSWWPSSSLQVPAVLTHRLFLPRCNNWATAARTGCMAFWKRDRDSWPARN